MFRCLALIALLTLAGCAAPLTPAAAPGDGVALLRGPISQAADPAALAIDGDAYFVLARRLPVTALADLVFTRAGAFHFEFVAGKDPGTGHYQLRNPDGLTVMGWRPPVDVNVRPSGTSPEGSAETDLQAFATTVTDGPGRSLPVALAPIALDRARYPDALDPQAVLPAGDATMRGALVTAVRPLSGGGAAVRLVALAADGSPEGAGWQVILPSDARLGSDAQALALVLDRDDRPDDGLDAFGPGWL